MDSKPDTVLLARLFRITLSFGQASLLKRQVFHLMFFPNGFEVVTERRHLSSTLRPIYC